MSSRLRPLYCLLLAVAFPLGAQEAAPPDPGFPPAGATLADPGYRLKAGDRIIVNIFGEPDLTAQQMIDRDGEVRLPLIGAVTLGGRTVREAERHIETAYRAQEMLKTPQVTLAMGAYAPREVTLLGAVRSPGTFQFPADATSLDIRDVIARQGGFTPVAKGDAVAVTRRKADGRETTTVVDVARLMFGRNRRNEPTFFIRPGDRIFVPERLF